MKPLLTEQDFLNAANRLNCEVAAIKAVAEVESGPYGAFLDSGEPVILFERHIFHRLTKGKHSTPENRNISWKTPSQKNMGAINAYGPPSAQHERLQKAVALDRSAALQSASWGKFQILGANYDALGYDNLQDFINRMYRSEADHLDSFVRFVEANGLAGALRTKDWRTFARKYNGPTYAKHNYHGRMAAAYKKFKAGEH